MVDPSAALAAFVMSVLSWYGMIRTGIERFNNDIHEITGRKTSVRINIRKLELLDDDMEKWRELWLILHKDMREDLHVTLWGRIAYDKIRKALIDMETKAEKAQYSRHLDTSGSKGADAGGRVEWKPRAGDCGRHHQKE